MAIIKKNYNLKIYKPYKGLPKDSLENWIKFYYRMYGFYLNENSPIDKKIFKKELIFLKKYLLKKGVKFI